MKRTGILIVMMAICLPLSAQPIKAFGVKTGLSIANQSFDYSHAPIEGPDGNLNHVCIGGSVEWHGRSNLSFLTEIFYMKKGSSELFLVTGAEGPEPIAREHWYYWIHYLSIPITAKWNVDLTHFNWYALLGPRVDVRLGQGSKLTGYDFSDPMLDSLYDDYEKMDYGVDLGAGVEMFVSPSFNLTAEYRYSPSLTRVCESKYLNIRNESHEVMVGFMF